MLRRSGSYGPRPAGVGTTASSQARAAGGNTTAISLMKAEALALHLEGEDGSTVSTVATANNTITPPPPRTPSPAAVAALVLEQFNQLALQQASSTSSSSSRAPVQWLLSTIRSHPLAVQLALAAQLQRHYATVARVATQVHHANPCSQLVAYTRDTASRIGGRIIESPPLQLAYWTRRKVSATRQAVVHSAYCAANVVHDQTIGRLVRSRPYLACASFAQALVADVRVVRALHQSAHSPSGSGHSSSLISSTKSGFSLAPLGPRAGLLQRFGWRTRRLVYAVARFSGQGRRHLFSRPVAYWPIDALVLLFQLLLIYLPARAAKYEAVRESLQDCLRWYELHEAAAPEQAFVQIEGVAQQQAHHQLLSPSPDCSPDFSPEASFLGGCEEDLSALSESPPALQLNLDTPRPRLLDVLNSPIDFESAASTAANTLLFSPASVRYGVSTGGGGGDPPHTLTLAPSSDPRESWRSAIHHKHHSSSASFASRADSIASIDSFGGDVSAASGVLSHANLSRRTDSIGTSQSHAVFTRALELLAREGIDLGDVDMESEIAAGEEQDDQANEWEDHQLATPLQLDLNTPNSARTDMSTRGVFDHSVDNSPMHPQFNAQLHSHSHPARPYTHHLHSRSCPAVDVSTIPEVCESEATIGVGNETSRLAEVTSALHTAQELTGEETRDDDAAGEILLESEAAAETITEPTEHEPEEERELEQPGEGVAEPLSSHSAAQTPEGKQSRSMLPRGDEEATSEAKPQVALPLQVHAASSTLSLVAPLLRQLRALLNEHCSTHSVRLAVTPEELQAGEEEASLMTPTSTVPIAAASSHTPSSPSRACISLPSLADHAASIASQALPSLHLIVHESSAETVALEPLVKLLRTIKLPENALRPSSFFLIVLRPSSALASPSAPSPLASLAPFGFRHLLLANLLKTKQVACVEMSSEAATPSSQELNDLACAMLRVTDQDLRDAAALAPVAHH